LRIRICFISIFWLRQSSIKISITIIYYSILFCQYFTGLCFTYLFW